MDGSISKARFAILDPLRMVAALAVVFYHYSIFLENHDGSVIALFKYGYLGVDFFFLLSGFVIMASAQGRGCFSFAFARVTRIYPAFIVCLLITIIVLVATDSNSASFLDVILNATILNDYFDVSNIDGVYWTLQAELKFYGCIFLLIFFGVFDQWSKWLGIWLLLAILYYFYSQPFFMGWFINPKYSFYFISGVCAYLLFDRDKSILIRIIFFVSAIFGVMTAGEQVKNFIPSPTQEDVFIARLISAAFFLFFYGLSQGLFNVKRSRRLWLYLGAMSYPLYLLHNATGKALIISFNSGANIYLLIGFVLSVILLVSLLIHLLVERPIGRLIKSRLVKCIKQ